MEAFAVIQSRFEQIPSEKLVEVLIEVGGMPHADAMRALRLTRGILGESFTRKQAEAIWKELDQSGFGVRVLAADELPALGEPRTIRWFELDQDELRIPVGIHGDTIPIPWPSVFVISCGRIADMKKELVSDWQFPTSYASESAESVDVGPRYKKRGKLVDVCDIIAVDDDGEFRYLRLPGNEISYGRIMGEGTELSRFERFAVVVEYLLEHAQEAIVSPETRKLVLNRKSDSRIVEGDATGQVYEHLLHQYNRWLLTQAIAREIENSE